VDGGGDISAIIALADEIEEKATNLQNPVTRQHRDDALNSWIVFLELLLPGISHDDMWLTHIRSGLRCPLSYPQSSSFRLHSPLIFLIYILYISSST
jgi:hypothetical protein